MSDPPRFTNVLRLAETTSTNLVAAEAARTGAREGLVVVADVQTAGRGRRDRHWVSPPDGALLCSVLFRPPLALGDVHLLMNVTALAAWRYCDRVAPGVTSIKWPNDLVTHQGKLAGLLAELVDPDPPTVVVGVGLNLSWPTGWLEDHPDSASELVTATTLELAGGRSIERDDALAGLLEELELAYEKLLSPGGPAATMQAYRAACSTIGLVVRVETPSGEMVGRATSIADSGALEVEVDGARVLVDVADVVHLGTSRSSSGGTVSL